MTDLKNVFFFFFALVLYLLHVSGDPRVEQQVQPGLVELLGGLHGDEDVPGADVLCRGRVGGGRGGARRPLHLPAAPGQLGEVGGEAALRRRVLLPEQSARPCVLLRARLRVQLSAVMLLLLHGDQDQQRADAGSVGSREGCFLSMLFKNNKAKKKKKKKD